MAHFKYREVEREIRQLAQTLPNGARLPPERHLAASYQCHFMTVRKALKNLVDDGTITRRLGSGTFVAHQGPPTAAPSLRHARQIGLLVHHQSNAYAHRLLQGIAHVAPEENVDIRSGWVRDFCDDGLQKARALKREGCAAITLPWFPHQLVDDVRLFVERSPLPVSLPLVIAGLEKNYFGDPSLFGGVMLSTTRDLIRYFQLLGRRHIALLGPDLPQDPILQKMLGAYTSHLTRENLPLLCGLAAPGSPAMDELARSWQAHRGDLAVVCYDDEHALRLMTAMHKIGLHAPVDFALIGHNDTEASRFSDPPLSTISQDFSHIGRWLLRNAVALSHGSSARVEGTSRDHLLVRGSCGGRGLLTPQLRRQLPALDLLEEPGSQPAPQSSPA